MKIGDLESEGLWAAKSLGICSPDERKEICFSIRVPSELGNEWALRKSGVKWIFSVEGEDLPQEEGPSIWHSAPKTGLRDPSAAVLFGSCGDDLGVKAVLGDGFQERAAVGGGGGELRHQPNLKPGQPPEPGHVFFKILRIPDILAVQKIPAGFLPQLSISIISSTEKKIYALSSSSNHRFLMDSDIRSNISPYSTFASQERFLKYSLVNSSLGIR